MYQQYLLTTDSLIANHEFDSNEDENKYKFVHNILVFSVLCVEEPVVYSSLCFFSLKVNHTNGKSLLLDWERVRMFDKEVAQLFLNLVKTQDSAR